MRVTCKKCGCDFDDEFRTTICPHGTFPANDGNNNFEHHDHSVVNRPRSYPDISEPLLPCPFCGGEAERFDDHDTGSTNEGGSCICCKRCNASTAMHFDRKENLVSSWNDRRRDAQAADIFKELGEPDHKLARWSHGAPAFEMWSRESIEAALLRVATQPLGVAQPPTNAADEIIGQIEERFPDWRNNFRDLVDCIDVTLHRLRGGS